MPRASLYLNERNAELLELFSKLSGKPKARILAEALEQYTSAKAKLLARKKVLEKLSALDGRWEEAHKARNKADVGRSRYWLSVRLEGGPSGGHRSIGRHRCNSGNFCCCGV